MQNPSASNQLNIQGSGVLGAGSSKPSLPTGDGVVTPLRAPRTPEPLSISVAEARGGMLSPPEPVGWTEPEATAYLGSGAKPQEGSSPSLTGGQKTVSRYDLGLQVAFLDPRQDDRDQDYDGGYDDGQQHDDDEGGGGGVQLSLDWYSVTLHPSSEAPFGVPEVLLATSLLLGCEPGDWVETESGSYGYQKGLVGPGGARLWWDAPGRDDIHVSLPGQACQLAGQERLVSFLRFCLGHGGKPTRCDTAIDDYRRIVSPGQVLETLQGPDVVTHAQKVLTQQGGVVGSRNLTGATVYLGAAGSRQRLRVYDKGLESAGKLDCIRWELESRKEAAETMAAALAFQDWGSVMASRLVGFVDFRVADSHSEVERRERLPWFQLLVGLARKASAYLPKVPRTAEQMVDWLDRAIGPTLAVAMKFWQGDLEPFSRMLRNGENRWKPRHKAMLANVGLG